MRHDTTRHDTTTTRGDLEVNRDTRLVMMYDTSSIVAMFIDTDERLTP